MWRSCAPEWNLFFELPSATQLIFVECGIAVHDYVQVQRVHAMCYALMQGGKGLYLSKCITIIGCKVVV